ncbi:transferase, Chloramphenicol acetyltransferase-like domain protein [Artemisia annua]|uniref:Transferase, Chloramphenicol acetyltransferase-like domain protein n=1 Tax=Artemisia annua TaxID=35608 RepID=A0A2U1KLU9_ARTAN|nr:transferase, Chloramphenicol acetyltransferase-like domain protein [Artemisia annua]
MVNVKQSFVIKPGKPTPSVSMCVSELDQEKHITHALIVYFYRPPSGSFSFTLASQELRDSLSQALVHFYPLAGRLHFIPGSGGRVALSCNSSGAIFYEARSSAKIEDFSDFSLPDERRSLVPEVDYALDLHELPLLMVQLTELGCGGISLGMGFSNIMVDGTCASHFIAEWARIARGNPIENQPFLDRSVLLAADPTPPPRFKHDRFEPNSLLIGQSDDQEERNKKITIVMLKLNKNQVQRLKDLANETRPTYISRPFSRFEAVAGHLWRCASMARGHQPMQPTKLYIPVSIRGRMPLPKWYFGNAIIKQAASSNATELVKWPLSYACGKIREAVEVVTEDYVKSALDDTKRQPDLTPFRTSHRIGSTTGSFDGNPNMEIFSWLGIPFEGLDFGWGKSIYMGPAAINVDGKSIVSSCEGEDGSLSVALGFQMAHVENLKKYFYQID